MKSPFDIDGLLADWTKPEDETQAPTAVDVEQTEESSPSFLDWEQPQTGAERPTESTGQATVPDSIPEDALELLGTTLHGFRLAKYIASGAYAHVFLGEHAHLMRTRAIKVLRAEVSAFERVRRRMGREVDALLSLRHPNVVAAFDYGEHSDGRAFAIMELVPGPTLSEVIKRDAPLDPTRAARISAQIAGGLAALHGAGIVHRDLAPSNVILTSVHGEETAKILDLGVSRFVEPGDRTQLTRVHDLIGTPAYMSPEQAASAATAGPASDVYALGVILHEMLTGERPEGPNRISAMDMPTELRSIVSELLREESALRPDARRAMQSLKMAHETSGTKTAPVIAKGRPSMVPEPTGQTRLLALGLGIVVIATLAAALVLSVRHRASVEQSAPATYRPVARVAPKAPAQQQEQQQEQEKPEASSEVELAPEKSPVRHRKRRSAAASPSEPSANSDRAKLDVLMRQKGINPSDLPLIGQKAKDTWERYRAAKTASPARSEARAQLIELLEKVSLDDQFLRRKLDRVRNALEAAPEAALEGRYLKLRQKLGLGLTVDGRVQLSHEASELERDIRARKR